MPIIIIIISLSFGYHFILEQHTVQVRTEVSKHPSFLEANLSCATQLINRQGKQAHKARTGNIPVDAHQGDGHPIIAGLTPRR